MFHVQDISHDVNIKTLSPRRHFEYKLVFSPASKFCSNQLFPLVPCGESWHSKVNEMILCRESIVLKLMKCQRSVM